MTGGPREYTILFLGETQSGKSTLIEFLRQFADPTYTINSMKVGGGLFSFTRDVTTTTIQTDLPSSFVTSKAGERIDYCTFIEGDQEDYEDELNSRTKYQLEREQSARAKVAFKLIDTPGLNDTSLFDEKNIAVIFKALKSVESIDLVVITVAHNPFTEDLRDAIKSYIHLLPELNDNIVFVHTRIDYAKLHPKETLFVKTIVEKKSILHNLMGRDSVPHLLIDNEIGSTRTIRNCITQNKLRDLLAMAKLNQPKVLQVMVINKTVKMKIVDAILQEKVANIIATRQETLGSKDRAQEKVLKKIGHLEAQITEYGSTLQNIIRDLCFHDKSDLVLLDEQRYDQDWSILKMFEAKTVMYYPGKTLSNAPGFVNHTLDHIDTSEHNIEVVQRKGGVGEKFWAVKFRRKRIHNGSFHVKIYIRHSKAHRAKVEELRTQEETTAKLLEDCKKELSGYQILEQEQKKAIQELVDDLMLNKYLLRWVSAERVHNKVFQAIVEAGVYVRDDAVSAVKLEKFYLEKKGTLEALESNVNYVARGPLDTTERTQDGSGESERREE